MDGSNSEILTRDIEHPEAITIDLDKKILYFSMQHPGYVSVAPLNSRLINDLNT